MAHVCRCTDNVVTSASLPSQTTRKVLVQLFHLCTEEMFLQWILPSGAMSGIQETIRKGINAVCRVYLLCSASGPRPLLEELLERSCLMEEIPQTPAEPRIQG